MSIRPKQQRARGHRADKSARSKAVGIVTAVAVVVAGLSVLLAPLSQAAAEPTASAPWIQSDKDDYPPGALVVLTGGDWQAGESVHINVNDDQGRTWKRDVDVVADQSGAIRDTFNLPDWFVATYKVVATGESSGVATTGFTDGNFKIAVSPAESATLAMATYGTTNCSGTATSSGTTTGRTLGLGTTESVRLEAPANAGGRTFDSWTYSGTPTTFATRSVCLSGDFNGTRDITANYVTPPSATATTTTLASSVNPSEYGNNVTFTATVTSSPTNPGSGAVTFKDGGTVLCADVALSGNQATCSTSALLPGSHSVTASYAPATGFLASTSGALSQVVAKRTVTGSFTAADKAYDGTTAATILTRGRTGVLNGDDVQLAGGSATFGNASVGQGKTVTGTGFTLTGTDAAKYQLASSTLTTTASIAARGLTVTFTAADKEYDGARSATITSADVSGEVPGEDVGVEGGSALFGTEDAGTDKTVTASGFVLTGADKDDYAIELVTPDQATITPKTITGSFTAAGKTYDRTTSASVTGTSLSGVIGDDVVSLTGGAASFADALAGPDKSVVLSGASLTGTDRANYALGQVDPATATIAPKPVTGSFTASNKTYDGNDGASASGRALAGVIAPDLVNLSGGTATFGNRHAGTGKTVTLSGATLDGGDAANYVLQSVDTAQADITPLEISGAFEAANKPYDGTDAAEISDRSLVGALAGDLVSLTGGTATFDTEAVGEGKTVTGTGFSLAGTHADNYTLRSSTLQTTADITRLVVVGHFTAADKDYDATTGASITDQWVTGQLPGDEVDLTGGSAVFDTKDVGEGKPVTLSGGVLTGDDAGNYALAPGAITTTADITPRELLIKADDASRAYGDADPEFTGSMAGVQGEEDITLVLTTAATETSGVGGYAIVPSVEGDAAVLANYDVKPTNGTLTVGKRTLTVTAHNKTKVYGDGNPTLTGGISGVRDGDAVTLGLDTDADEESGVGPHAIVATAQGTEEVLANYEVVATNGTLTVTRRDLFVEADNASRPYGAANPVFEGSIEGIQNGDDVTEVFTSAATELSGVGPYVIVASVSGAEEVLANYRVVATNGTLTVTPRELTVTAHDQTKVYGAANPTLTGDIDGVQNGDPVTLGLTTAADETSGVGPHAILATAQGTAAVLANYEVVAVNGTLTVTPRELTVTAHNQTKVYGEENPTLTGDIDGVQNGDPVTLGLTTDADETSGVGPHAIEPSAQGTAAVLANYEVVAINGTLTVTPRELTVTAHNQTKVYGEENPTLTGSITGVQNGDVITLGLTTDADETSAVDSYAIVPSAGGDAGVLANYEVVAVNGTLTVTPRELTVTAHDQTKVYGAANPTLTGDIDGVQNGDPVTLGLTTAADETSGVGPHAILATAQGTAAVLANYEVVAVNGTLTVTPRELTVTAHDQTKVYGDANPTLTGDIDGVQNGDAVTLGLDANADETSGVGPHAIEPSAQGTAAVLANYEVVAIIGTLTVTPRELTVTAHNKTKVYGDANPTLTGNITGVQNGDAVTLGLTTAATETARVGGHVIVASAQGTAPVLANYEVVATNGTLTVTKRELLVSADDKTKVYGASNPPLTGDIVGVQNGDAVTLHLSSAANGTSGVGDYAILALAQGAPAVLANYDVVATNGILTVTKRDLVLTADSKSKVYGAANPLLTGQITGVQNNDPVTLALTTGADATSAVGTYAIVPSAQATAAVLANYDVRPTNGTLTVTKAPLTITADDQTRLVGAANPVLTYRVTGLVNQDTRSTALDSEPTVSTTATASSGAGSYPITVSGGTARNYDLSYVEGTLRVMFGWAGFLQPINDTAHQTGLNQSKFKLGQTVPVKFVLTDAAGNVVQQSSSPTFSRTDYLGACDSGTSLESSTSVAPSNGAVFTWTGSQYQYNWSTKGLSRAGEYRIHANLADGSQRAVYICLTK